MSQCTCNGTNCQCKTPKFHPGLKVPFAVRPSTDEEGRQIIKYFEERGVENPSFWRGDAPGNYYGMVDNIIKMNDKGYFNNKVCILYDYNTFKKIIDSPLSSLTPGQEVTKALEEWIKKLRPAILVPETCKITYVDLKEVFEKQKGIVDSILEDWKELGKKYNIELDKIKSYIPYQLCPKCNGRKTIGEYNYAQYTTGGATYIWGNCNICNGQGIIPMHEVKK